MIFGVACLVGINAVTGYPPVDAATITAAGVGALLPDIDHPQSKLGSRLLFLSLPISLVFGHRGITHSLLMVVILSIFLALRLNALPAWAVAGVIGYLSHLLGDWMTPAGIPLLWPRKTKFHSPVQLFTGSFVEVAFGLALSGLLVYAYMGRGGV